ncbi:hypothetical protein Poli38472_001551 [Pythium oligandrum]|uniref:Peptidase S26 domain-containing protein n=1 Tax=Pythium oligandrum TaxID=41045 RepID=A0A8K1CVE1_PYTOL|nr:hypothetical protein Poli38472_001551 [Pythium oligandrum]|eukprot:TMW69395.1 hypothetical protein Poli38472_001551 [Pythium oligandrum]
MAGRPTFVRNAALLLGWTFTVKHNVCDFIYGVGRSMEPVIPDGSVAVIDRLTPHWRAYQRGDVVLLRSPTRKDGSFVIKRILAMEGDTVELQPRFDQSRADRVVVPKGHLWVEGDNATMSVDSRHIGAVPAALMEGRVQAIAWPLERMGRIR